MTTFGVWASIYVGSVVALMYQLVQRSLRIEAVLGAGFLAMGLYVLHRMSPTVTDAMQPRHIQAARQSRTMLFIFGLAGVISAGMFFTIEPTLMLLLPIGCIGVTLYGRKTVFAPLRNITYFKPVAVGCSIAALGWVLVEVPWPPYAVICMAIVVAADAMLCDFPDVSYDDSCGCITIPSKIRGYTVWCIACVANVLAACFLWFVMDTNIGLIMLALFPLLYLLRKFDIRVFVDLRLLLVAVIAWAV